MLGNLFDLPSPNPRGTRRGKRIGAGRITSRASKIINSCPFDFNTIAHSLLKNTLDGFQHAYALDEVEILLYHVV